MRGGGTLGAPVDAQGEPIYYNTPDSWDDAKNDGERWRWALDEYAKLGPNQRYQSLFIRAQFLQSQFGVETLAEIGPLLARMAEEDAKPQESGTYALHTLGEDETIARLATGVRRFKLPDEHNHIKLLQQIIAGRPEGREAPSIAADVLPNAASRLGQVFKNRRQYPRAAEYFQLAIDNSQGSNRKGYQRELDQITGNWGQFEQVVTQPAGQGAKVDFRFRNGKSVDFVARQVNVRQLLEDVKEYLDSRPAKLAWEKINISDLGQRLLQEQGQKYLERTKSRPSGRSISPRRKNISTNASPSPRRSRTPAPTGSPPRWPTATPATSSSGSPTRRSSANRSTGKRLYFVADANNGQPIAGATLEFFGYRQRSNPNRPNRFDIDTVQLRRDHRRRRDGANRSGREARGSRLPVDRDRHHSRGAAGLPGLQRLRSIALPPGPVQPGQGLRRHRSPRLSAGPDGPLQGVGPARPVRRTGGCLGVRPQVVPRRAGRCPRREGAGADAHRQRLRRDRGPVRPARGRHARAATN